MNYNVIKIINYSACESKRMKTKGLGGTRILVKTKDEVTYIVKPDNLNQSLNEIMVQIILKSLGLFSIDYAYIKIGDVYYGSLKYIDGLKRIYVKNYNLLTKKQKIDFLKHLFLNAYLVNSDLAGEIYITKDNKIVSLDYGEAGVSIPLLGIDKIPVEGQRILLTSVLNKTKFDYVTRYVLIYIDIVTKNFFDDEITASDLKNVIIYMLDSIIDADFTEYEEFVKSLLSLHNELLAYIYQEHLNGLINTAKELKKNIDKIWKEMPSE